MIYIACNSALVWIPLAFWIVQRTWTRGEKLKVLKKRMDKIVWWWTANNRRMIRWLKLADPEINWPDRDTFSSENWYLVICNHQSWTDILLLQSYLYGTLPPLKFFTKQELIWVPFIGLAMHVLGFPYVKRVTKEQIRANPELRTADRDNTIAACDDFKNHPTAILNFVEGTRRTSEKHARQGGDFRYLLRPKVGGLGYVIEGMGTDLECLLDVTIIYHDGVPTFWEFLQGKGGRIEMEMTRHTIPEHLLELDESARRSELAQWIKELWMQKDEKIASVMNGS